MQNALTCQITSTKKMNMKICKTFPMFFKIFWKRFLWTLDFGKLRAIILNMAKIHKPLVKKETSDLLSSRIVLNDWKTIYAFKLECKKVILHGIYNMKNFLIQVNLVSSITITKNKLIKVFILKVLYFQYIENAKRESKNINDICWVDDDELK